MYHHEIIIQIHTTPFLNILLHTVLTPLIHHYLHHNCMPLYSLPLYTSLYTHLTLHALSSSSYIIIIITVHTSLYVYTCSTCTSIVQGCITSLKISLQEEFHIELGPCTLSSSYCIFASPNNTSSRRMYQVSKHYHHHEVSIIIVYKSS